MYLQIKDRRMELRGCSLFRGYKCIVGTSIHTAKTVVLYGTHGIHSNRHERCCLTRIETSEKSHGIHLQIIKTVLTYTLQIVIHF